MNDSFYIDFESTAKLRKTLGSAVWLWLYIRLLAGRGKEYTHQQAMTGLGINRSKLQRWEAKLIAHGLMERKPEPGYIYLISDDSGCFKIGKTLNVKERLSNLQCGNPNELKLIASIYTPDMIQTETFLHFEYASRRVRGDWFRLSWPEVESIKSYQNKKGTDHAKI